ncbi:CRISPR-associated endonuclease Cas1 [Lachnobacterium bovis]|uniref:CRISPR-associated endonuclease Cas1 n=1 Tax=Lachnobacterium bovis TaxID=140626 RepID=A0A1H9S2D4_9FIRM|nr:CRISPR-associated endonuclease Cas1 [Lachnobacterium bovis]SER78299.1 CRISP-associated protein Cas1 [Lachnobacterium bovis]
MSQVYIDENGAQIGTEGNRLTIKYRNGDVRSFPIETIESIIMMGKSQLTTQCMEKCMNKGIPVAFFSKGGKYFGRLMSSGHVKPELQRKQSALYDTDFAFELSRKIIKAKIQNQTVVLRRYAKSRDLDLLGLIVSMKSDIKHIDNVKNIPELMGYEGNSAKIYFKGLSQCVDDEFEFEGRSKRPPKDPFNSLISLGYSILMNNIYEVVEEKGLNPYFGFMHRDGENHPTLVSDLMEEWRAVLIDSTAMSLINGKEILRSNFYTDYENPGVFIDKDGLNIFISKLEMKLKTSVKYLKYVDYAVSFRRAIALQVMSLVKAIESQNPDEYEPIVIR